MRLLVGCGKRQLFATRLRGLTDNRGPDRHLQAVVEAIRNAKRPILYVGGGCVDSRECGMPALPRLPLALTLVPPSCTGLT